MKYLFLLLPTLAFTLLLRPFSAPAAAPLGKPAPETTAGTEAPLAVLELFTSQGCSSCPPADELLREFDARAQAGEPIIALSYHVDYWNYLGWKDPFSSAYFSARQTDYTERIGARTYTPQLVINGTQEMVGSRRGQVKAAVTEALRNARQDYAPVLTTHLRNGKVTVAYTLEHTAALKDYRVTALLTQKTATSAVVRGENRGKELRHHNVVRVMEHAPAAAAGTFVLALPDGLTAGGVEVVLLVQHTQTHALTGAGHAVVSAR